MPATSCKRRNSAPLSLAPSATPQERWSGITLRSQEHPIVNLTLTSQPVATTTTVPTSAEINGDFSQTLSGACNGNKGGPYTVNPSSGLAFCNDTPTVVDPNQLYNPFTATLSGTTVVRKPIVNNQLTSVGHAFDPVAQAYLGLSQHPMRPAQRQPTGRTITSATPQALTPTTTSSAAWTTT